MAHSNNLITFLRHYGPISASDNMYDELIQSEIKRHGINPAIHIDPAYLDAVRLNFESITPRNVILTGTAGDGKTYHCRRIWENFCGDSERWKAGDKIVSLVLPASGKRLVIVKDLSELTQIEKHTIIENLSSAIAGDNINDIFLIAANDGQLLASWREWTETHEEDIKDNFKIVENMLVEERETDDDLILNLYNLSRIDASTHFKKLVNIIVEHPQWSQCEGCELLDKNGISSCPIRINRERLRGGEEDSVFIRRLGALMKLARANRMHLPIRDLLLLCVNIILGDRQGRQILLTCLTAKNRAVNKDYRLTNPYANVFGMNLPERQRQQYQVFTTLEAFGIGRETDNKFDNLLIYGAYNRSNYYNKYVANDDFYGSNAYSFHLRNYLEGEHDNITKFLRALGRQRQRLFFSLPPDEAFDPWRLTVYQASGRFLEFVSGLNNGTDVTEIIGMLVKGLNRTFCGMMIDDGTQLYVASSGGDGRGRIASLLNHKLSTKYNSRNPYIRFILAEDHATPCLQVIDPVNILNRVVDNLNLQLTHFEYLIRVASGSLPTSFSRQCYEDFLDFKLRLIKRLDDLYVDSYSSEISTVHNIDLQELDIDDSGSVHSKDIQITVGQ